jgi:hypothetical protein
VPGRPTPRHVRRSAGALAGFLLLTGAGVALAPVASAADDPAKPDYSVTDGPSCHPGGVHIHVVAGTAAYRVVLATTREPDGEDSADLAPGESVTLATGEVAYGETVDSRLLFTALDGSGETYADELVPYSFTRPSREDCAAIAPVLEGAPAPTTGALPPPDGGPAGPEGTAEDPVEAVVPGLDVQVAAAELPAAPVTRTPDWALLAAGGSLTATAAWFGVAARRRRLAAHAGRTDPARGTMAG